ncbi:MAG: phosphatase PAP2 family protein [ANME-2 cluster archaeon]|nr:MAG: phosphatase PAP2 family protein [ANME-2 cluster archaeon]
MITKILYKNLHLLFFNLFSNILHSIWKFNFLLHIFAVLITYVFVISNIDWIYYTFFINHRLVQYIFFPAVIIGGLLPVLLPAVLYVKGTKKKSNNLKNLSLIIGQSTLISLFFTSFYKAITGRLGPEPFSKINMQNYSTDFKFGFLERGIFDGWPSGHASAAFALAFLLIKLFPENKLIKYVSLIYAVFIAFGVSISIHWLSDAIAGALIGITIGCSIGDSFKSMNFTDFDIKCN